MKAQTIVLIGRLQQIIIGRPATKYQYHNCCTLCNLWYPKSLGGRCPECSHKARTVSPSRNRYT